MATRLDLQTEFENLLGNRNVYFQPPSSLTMKYPCIRYALSDKDLKYADGRIYKSTNRYEVIVIDYDPDSDIPDKILAHFPMCSFDRMYVSSNLNHFVLTLYY